MAVYGPIVPEANIHAGFNDGIAKIVYSCGFWRIVVTRCVQLVSKSKTAEIPYPGRVEDSIEVIAFVLNYAGVKSIDGPVNRFSVLVEAGVAKTIPARHKAAHSRH